jgi:hypothetical protein
MCAGDVYASRGRRVRCTESPVRLGPIANEVRASLDFIMKQFRKLMVLSRTFGHFACRAHGIVCECLQATVGHPDGDTANG